MKNLSLLTLCLALAGCAHGFPRQHSRGPASLSEENKEMNPGRYDVYCGALLPASEHFELLIRKGSHEAVIAHNNLRSKKPFDRRIVKQTYAVQLTDTGDKFVFTGENFELMMIKSDYSSNGTDILVPSHLKAEFQGRNLGIENPNCVFAAPKN